MNDTEHLTAGEARDLLHSTEEDARRAIDVPSAPLFATWGVFWIVGYLAIWWSVRGLDPYTGPAGWAMAVLGALGVVAAIVTVVVITRASRGVDGPSRRTGAFYGLSWPVAFIAAETTVLGLARAGASDEVLGVAAAVLPALVVAVIYCVSAAVWGETAFFVAGVALAAGAALGSLLGPVDGVLALAVVGGAGFVAATAMGARAR